MVPIADGLGQVDYVDSTTFGSEPLYIPHGNTGSTETFDTTGVPDTWHSATLDSATVTFTFTGAIAGEPAAMLLELHQDSTGGRLVTWPGSVIWPGGVAPTLSTAGSAVDILTFFTRDGGTNWYGFATGGSGVTYATPAIVLGTAVAAGAASSVIRSDSTIVAFDATVPTTIAYSDAAATGSAAVAARRDHRHGAPAAGTGIGPILISDTPSTPLIFADLIQNEAQDDLVYADP
jgi:hypothetical protein